MRFLGADLPDEDGVRHTGEPRRLERKVPHVREQQPHRRIERDRQHGRRGHRQRPRHLDRRQQNFTRHRPGWDGVGAMTCPFG